MFFRVTLTADLTLMPKDMGRRLDQLVEERLRETYEGKINGENGYVVIVLKVMDDWKGSGVLEETYGAARYKIKFDALVFRPFKNEVVDGIVTDVVEHGFFCQIGPVKRAFVSRHQMPPDIKEFNMEQSKWISDDRTVEIKRGASIRLRIMEARLDLADITVIGSIRGDYLGAASEAAAPE